MTTFYPRQDTVVPGNGNSFIVHRYILPHVFQASAETHHFTLAFIPRLFPYVVDGYCTLLVQRT